MKKIALILLSALVFVSCNTNQKKPPIAKNGVLDLRNWDFERDGEVELKGKWEFYWMKHYFPNDFIRGGVQVERNYIHVPGSWKDLKYNGNLLPNSGYSTYRLLIIGLTEKKPLKLRLWTPASSYRIFKDDSLLITVGTPGKTKETTNTQYIPNEQPIIFNRDSISITIQVSDFENGIYGTRSQGLVLYDLNQFDKSHFITLFFMTFSMGSIFIIGIYYTFIFFIRRRDINSLVFAVYCFLVFIYSFILNGWMVRFSIEIPSYLSTILSTLSFLLYIFLYLFTYNIFKKEFNKFVLFFIIFLSVSFSIISLFSPPKNFSDLGALHWFICMIINIYALFAITKGILNKIDGSVIFLFGYFAIIFVNINDVLFNFNTELIPYFITQYGLLVMIFCQAIVLAKRFSKAFDTVEEQTLELTKHKEHLEELVDERTIELRTEKDKSEKLLLNVLPEQIAGRLKQGETTIADHFEEVSVIFIDIADFTKLNVHSKPQDMVKMLNDIFTIFDKISAKYGLEKIKTIGDCYMAAAGIPVPRKDHAEAVANMAIEAMETMIGYRVSGLVDCNSYTQNPIPEIQEIRFRIGLDCGPVVAGVIGEQKFIYDLWGDMVNTASRMETHGIIGKIQITERFKNKLEIRNEELGIKVDGRLKTEYRKFKFEERGEIEVKGKGIMKTYFLVNCEK